jgi:hypothetical protein
MTVKRKSRERPDGLVPVRLDLEPGERDRLRVAASLRGMRTGEFLRWLIRREVKIILEKNLKKA